MDRPVFSALKTLFAISDEQAMWRVQTQDDHRAFGLLVQRWEGPIHDLCTRMTGDAHRAEDLKQETFGRAFDRRASYKPGSRFSTWLWRIGLNLCYDELRRRARRRESPLEDEDAEAIRVVGAHEAEDLAPDSLLAAQEEAALVRRALMELPEKYRSVLVLRHYQNLKLREIAEVLEIPEGTVNSRMAEALTQLTRLLEPQLIERPADRAERSNPLNPSESFVL